MDFSLDQRSATLSVGEFADFTVGPRDASQGGSQGVWRAQLGTRWHQEFRAQALADHQSSAARKTTAAPPAAEPRFEVVINGEVMHRGWRLVLQGRIDQIVVQAGRTILREIKTVLRPLPMDEAELRQDYPSYFAQLATYLALQRMRAPSPAEVQALSGELVFVEASTGLAQTVPVLLADDALFRTQLERLTQFLDLRLRARERLRDLRFQPPFASLRAGQETTQADLTAALARGSLVLFEAPTGFGKTGALLEIALKQLKAGRYSRAIYLTSKATGQLQVVRTLGAMAAPEAARAAGNAATTPVAAWHVRNKGEHCVNTTFHCVREHCGYLDDLEARWPASGLARFYLFENTPRDIAALRDAGRAARICPYEITRTALAFNDVWIGDYNYVFAPANRGLFEGQPGFAAAETLLIVDEAHNLPSRVADAHSHVVQVADALLVQEELHHVRAPGPFQRLWETWTVMLASLKPCDVVDFALEDDLADTIRRLADQLQQTPLDYAELSAKAVETLWLMPALAEWMTSTALTKLLWSPREGELRFTCLDAAPAIAATLRRYGAAILASATLQPFIEYTTQLGLDAAATAVGQQRELAEAPPAPPQTLIARTPWRDRAYDIAYDVRVDTSYQRRAGFARATAATIERLHASAPPTARTIVVFFPSYAYAESIVRTLEATGSVLRVALQPRLQDLAAQTAWVEESLAFADALFLVLGSSFAEGIDLLGGRIAHAMVVGPALPEVNAVQRARMEAYAREGKETAFRRVYQIPGIQKVNQALGRLVRAPGHQAKVLLHCRRFLEPSYARLLAPDYQFGTTIATTAEFDAWLERPHTGTV